MPDFWEFPTVSMGLGPIQAIYQARFNRYLEDRGLKPKTDAKVWAFLGDGETDEPESLGAITLASREKLDNLIFVINCNLQRLDGPVRGNGQIIQELEAIFRGAGWNVIKVIHARDWDDLLARHYRLGSVNGPQFRRVAVEDDARRGLLGKGAVLLRTSYGDRTSPVLRGAWVLDKLMGTPPTPPPPNVETDLSTPPGEKAKTVRARLEQHREDASCNGCHGVIDPYGLALETFSATGQWRDFDAQAEERIDAATVLPGGQAINGPIELRQALLQRPDQFVQALTVKLMMYALGRELEYFDMPQVRAVVREAEGHDYRFAAIATGIVSSDSFRMQAFPDVETDDTGRDGRGRATQARAEMPAVEQRREQLPGAVAEVTARATE
jgi:hypothetical protein